MFAAILRIEILIWFRTKENVFWSIVWPLLWLLLVWGLFPPFPGRSELETLEYYYPSGVALVLLASCLTSLSARLGSAKENNELKRLAVAPMPLRTFFLGQLCAAAFSAAISIAVVTVASFALGARPHGNVLAAAGMVVLAAVAFAGVAFLIAGRTDSQAKANLISLMVMFFFMFLSNIIFDFSGAPGPFALLSKLLPGTALCSALRGLLFEDSLFSEQGSNTIILMVWAGGASLLALSTFKVRQGG
jgi:ABC-2 type transport system permease protein